MLYFMSYLKFFVLICRYPHLLFSLVGGCLGASCLFLGVFIALATFYESWFSIKLFFIPLLRRNISV